jgi:8-oxo-dGTP pyrophosphatase MutT (NUDIX family)
LDLEPPGDGQEHQYCWGCRAEGVSWLRINGRSMYDCVACGLRSDRSVVIDPAVRWWIGSDGEYWHESAGVFVCRGDGRFLFFERIDFPVCWTVPAGHVDTGEASNVAAARELLEEVGLAVAPAELVHVGTDDIVGDSCRRGSDAHRWHAYLADVDIDDVRVREEGHRPTWLTLDEALEHELSVPVRHMLTRYAAGGVLSGAARVR